METKKMVEEAAGGNYKKIFERFNADDATEEELTKARHITNCSIQIQWVPPGDSKKAESSFFKINEQGVPLDDTELASLYSRDCPNSIAARGINQFGTGNIHWRRFKGETRTTVEKLSKEIHAAMFHPLWEGNTIQSPMLPISGRSFVKDSLSLVVDTVNIANSVPEVNIKKVKSKEAMEQIIKPDPTGEDTINYLKQTRNTIGMIKGFPGEHRSLDLYPLVYFYSGNGKHMPTSFLAWVELIKDWDKKQKLMHFTAVRKDFEEFLIEHKSVLSQVSRRVRGQIGAVHEVKRFLETALDLFIAKKSAAEVAQSIHESDGYDFANPPVLLTKKRKSASPEAKSKTYISNIALPKASICTVCGARVVDTSISFDHNFDAQYGGLSHVDNLEPTHHYCNGGKNALLAFIAKFRGAA